jgi:hypothetical protein
MHVICKKCGSRIEVARRPRGSTQTCNVQLQGNVRLEGGGISFGPGGSISFRPGGLISFGKPRASEFVCIECGHTDTYLPEEILE